MKKILTILTMIASLTFTSCEDFLTEEVRGQQNLDTYFQSAEEAEAFITGLLPGHYFWRMVEYQHSMVAFRDV